MATALRESRPSLTSRSRSSRCRSGVVSCRSESVLLVSLSFLAPHHLTSCADLTLRKVGSAEGSAAAAAVESLDTLADEVGRDEVHPPSALSLS